MRHLSKAMRVLVMGALVALLAAPSFAAGFGIFEQGSKAMGLAGAFTGQADDPSALFHNVGGLAFLDEQMFQVGVTLINVVESDFQGANPFPGAGVQESVMNTVFTPVHAYWIRPLTNRINLGLSFNTPFGLAVEWDNPATFDGRFISTNAEIVTFDFGANLGFKLSERLGIGVGLIGRASEVGLERFAPSLNPFTQTIFNAAFVDLESDLDFGVGFQIGLLHKVGTNFSWGLSYRGTIEVDYSGDGRLTQVSSGNPVLDGIVAGSLPFDIDLPIETSIEFPDLATAGISVGLTENTRLNADIVWTGWSSFDQLAINFLTAPALSSLIDQEWEDVYSYRIGIAYRSAKGRDWRFGFVRDESPQPEESVGPILPDADRSGFTFGVGLKKWDLALMYLLLDERTSLTNSDGFFGTYDTEAVLFGGTYRF